MAVFVLDIWVGAEIEIGLQSGTGIVFEFDLGFWVALVFGLVSWVEPAFGLKAWVELFGLRVGVEVGGIVVPQLEAVVGLRSWTVVMFGLAARFEVVVEAAASAGSELVVCLLKGTGATVSAELVDQLWAIEFVAAIA